MRLFDSIANNENAPCDSRYKARGRLALAQALAIYFVLSLFLNFFVPARVAVTFLEVVCTLLIWVIYTRGATRRDPFYFCTLVIFPLILLNLVIGGSAYILSKLALYPIVFLAFESIGRRLSTRQLYKLIKIYLLGFFLFLAINVLFAIHLGRYETRKLWAFYHVNLAGSYVAGTVLPVTILMEVSGYSQKLRRWLLVLEAFITRSSGAFLATLFMLVNLRKIRIRKLMFASVAFLALASTIIIVGRTYNTSYYKKLRDAGELVIGGKEHRLIELAKRREALKRLGQAGSGSLTWRFYNYVVYFRALSREQPLQLLLGEGAGSYRNVWREGPDHARRAGLDYMPHNDFILILRDFGALGEAIFLAGLMVLVWKLRHRPIWYPAITVIVLELLFENNIYSAWLMISWLTWLGLAASLSKYRREIA